MHNSPYDFYTESAMKSNIRDNIQDDMKHYFKVKHFDLPLDKIKEEALFIVDEVINNYGITFLSDEPKFGQGSLSTKLFSSYNTFLFNQPTLYLLFTELKNFFIEAFQPKESYYIQSWINVHNKNEFLSWHGHWPTEVRSYHGYFGVNVEPSVTSYIVPPFMKLINIKNSNNKCLINKSDGDKHRVSKWNENESRISIAFDIIPFDSLQKLGLIDSQHFIPLIKI